MSTRRKRVFVAFDRSVFMAATKPPRPGRKPYFHVYQVAGGRWAWELRTANHRPVARSPATYTRRDRCERAIERTRAAVSGTVRY